MEKIQERTEQICKSIEGKPITESMAIIAEDLARTQVLLEISISNLGKGLAETFENLSAALDEEGTR
jgi:hypothetical protein